MSVKKSSSELASERGDTFLGKTDTFLGKTDTFLGKTDTFLGKSCPKRRIKSRFIFEIYKYIKYLNIVSEAFLKKPHSQKIKDIFIEKGDENYD